MTFYIPKSQQLDDIDKFYDAVKLAHRYMRDLRSTSIPHAIEFTKQEFESIDKRFEAHITHIDNSTTIKLKPKERIDTQLSIHPEYKEEFINKFRKIIEYGGTEEIDLKSVKLFGSPLYDMLNLKQINYSYILMNPKLIVQ